jgi:hypothetical protein
MLYTDACEKIAANVKDITCIYIHNADSVYMWFSLPPCCALKLTLKPALDHTSRLCCSSSICVCDNCMLTL